MFILSYSCYMVDHNQNVLVPQDTKFNISLRPPISALKSEPTNSFYWNSHVVCGHAPTRPFAYCFFNLLLYPNAPKFLINFGQRTDHDFVNSLFRFLPIWEVFLIGSSYCRPWSHSKQVLAHLTLQHFWFIIY